MARLQRIGRLPENFDDFVEEIAAGLSKLYGEQAATEYRAAAAQNLKALIAHPQVDALALCQGAEVVGLLLATVQDQVGRISFLHVLRRNAGRGLEQALLREAVGTLRAGGVEGILSEYIPFCALKLEATYHSLGFDKVERLIMGAALDVPGLACNPPLESAPYHEDAWPEIASLIVAAYEDHPGKQLHNEVRDAERAYGFLARAARGAYGPTRPAFCRAIRREGSYVGAIIGCCVAPDVGFVIQVVVQPAFQRQGIGATLVRELADAFRAAGQARITLGVTATNPARRLYTRLGFEPLQTVDAYTWWRP